MSWPAGKRPRSRAEAPPPRIDLRVPFERDPEAQRFVREHPGGATLEEVATMAGVTRERIRQIEAAALRKLSHICQRIGVQLEQILPTAPGGWTEPEHPISDTDSLEGL